MRFAMVFPAPAGLKSNLAAISGKSERIKLNEDASVLERTFSENMDDGESGTSEVEIERSDGDDSAAAIGRFCRLRPARIAATRPLIPTIAPCAAAGEPPTRWH
ncbi:MAG: hypothetical protein ACQESR_04285 [Planctomycetota bacterium]